MDETLDFIASLPHGEAKAAALTVFNLMTRITEDRIKPKEADNIE